MRNKLVVVPSVREPIMRSPGFAKKLLSSWKLDIMALCGFGCRYCSSNTGNYLRINREPFADLTEAQIGERIYPADDPSLTFLWRDVIEKLDAQLAGKPASWGAGETVVFSMLTDGFSPSSVQDGVTEGALRRVVEKTSFRIRILTKNAIVGSKEWVQFFGSYPGRFVVGLSTGTVDDTWAKRIEIGTSTPSARLRALRNLQDAGVPTYGMLCPVFPDMLDGSGLDALVDAINAGAVEHVWAEPYNDRINWRAVREGYDPDSNGYRWFTYVYERGGKATWSRYATDLYMRLRERASREGWLSKLRYLLYEDLITAEDAREFGGLEGILLQSKADADGTSQNPHISRIQKAAASARHALAGGCT